LICPSSPSEAFIFTELRGNKVSFTAKVLAAVGDGCTTNILKEAEGPPAWIGICVKGMAPVSCRYGKYNMNIVFVSYN
jgi:hypothetical protein